MKELKLKAWDKKKKEWIKHFAITKDGLLMIMRGQGEWEDSAKYGTENVIIVRYTGLKDKNSKEIYEDDLVEYTNSEYKTKETGHIIFENGTYCVAKSKTEHGYYEKIEFWDDGEHDWYTLENVDMNDIEVIGNINEDKDLIKER